MFCFSNLVCCFSLATPKLQDPSWFCPICAEGIEADCACKPRLLDNLGGPLNSAVLSARQHEFPKTLWIRHGFVCLGKFRALWLSLKPFQPPTLPHVSDHPAQTENPLTPRRSPKASNAHKRLWQIFVFVGLVGGWCGVAILSFDLDILQK